MRRPRFVTVALIAGTVLGVDVLAGCTGDPAPEAEESTQVPAVVPSGPAFYASPQGTGDCHTPETACALATALGVVVPGGTVLLAAGEYGSMELTGDDRLATFDPPAVVEAPDGVTASFDRLSVKVPGVTWRGLRVTGVWFVDGPAKGTRIERAHLDGTGLFVRSQGVTVVDSLFENGSSVDGIQIGGAQDVLIEGNTVRDYDQGKDNGLHADCIQVFDSSDVTIRGNKLSNCYNAGLIISPGRRKGSDNLLIESNYIQGCVVKTDKCRGGSATDLRELTVTNITVRNNTFLNGSVRVDPLVGMVFDRNIVEYLSTCDAPVTNSVIEKWNTKTCKVPEVIGRDGNRAGVVRFADRDAGDLRLTDVDSARITPSGDRTPAKAAIDGKPMSPEVAGASMG
ncbi:right-handed parallel beta-helix repeat-containing protein [Xylanimonas allomyrinae]|uniref:Right-handed parallel beta-helix repeat-containing protein n=1 Tax=Xylanimonas allomyrinae TaxID=2509459 RepID=A0A4P6F0V9_9MICO|nr:right-handed parallel beta-helix repeat-containing protein [Xylanimonas allomyrinae]QAY63968.1 right-handed parallel beta-helix repeat-containing protein [Xylanimonas allomyrinae]